jgi:hypothetical protein
MDLVMRRRIDRIERQLKYLYEHLALYPGAAESVALPVPPEVYEHARSGNRPRAVKAYCEATRADLAAGRAFVDLLAGA